MLPEVHGVGKNLDPILKPEKQHAIPEHGSMERLHIGQKRPGSRRKRPDPSINQLIKHPTCHKNSWKNRIRNKENKPCAFQRSDTLHKQCKW